MTDTLQLRENAKYELEQIRDIETGTTYLNKLDAVEVWVKKENKDVELEILLKEQRLRTKRILGMLIKEGQKNGEIRKQNSGAVTAPKSVTQLGITQKQSSDYQAIADIPEETFEEFITEKKLAVNRAVKELTTKGAVRLSRTITKQDVKREQQIETRLELEKEIHDLAREIRSKYKKQDIELLIKFLTK